MAGFARKRFKLLVSLFSLIALSLVAPAASAAPPEFVSGGGEFEAFDTEFTIIHESPGVTILGIEESIRFTGTIEAIATVATKCVVPNAGLGSCVGQGTLTGEIAGRDGEAVIRYQFLVDPATDAINGHIVLLGNSGELAGMVGRATFQGTGGTGTYTVDLIFTS